MREGGGGGSDDNLCGRLTVKAKKSTSQLLATIKPIKELSRHLLLKKADPDVFCHHFKDAVKLPGKGCVEQEKLGGIFLGQKCLLKATPIIKQPKGKMDLISDIFNSRGFCMTLYRFHLKLFHLQALGRIGLLILESWQS
jgi:hypothetical protein